MFKFNFDLISSISFPQAARDSSNAASTEIEFTLVRRLVNWRVAVRWTKPIAISVEPVGYPSASCPQWTKTVSSWDYNWQKIAHIHLCGIQLSPWVNHWRDCRIFTNHLRTQKRVFPVNALPLRRSVAILNTNQSRLRFDGSRDVQTKSHYSRQTQLTKLPHLAARSPGKSFSDFTAHFHFGDYMHSWNICTNSLKWSVNLLLLQIYRRAHRFRSIESKPPLLIFELRFQWKCLGRQFPPSVLAGISCVSPYRKTKPTFPAGKEHNSQLSHRQLLPAERNVFHSLRHP